MYGNEKKNMWMNLKKYKITIHFWIHSSNYFCSESNTQLIHVLIDMGFQINKIYSRN